jgi:hypothetical protein
MSKNYISKNVLALVGLIVLLPAAMLQLGGFTIADELTTTRITLVLSVIALLCCVRSFNQPNIYLRIASIIVVIGATIIILMNLYQLI